jgi:hypothetical protein
MNYSQRIGPMAKLPSVRKRNAMHAIARHQVGMPSANIASVRRSSSLSVSPRDINTIAMYFRVVTAVTVWLLLFALSMDSAARGDDALASVLGKEISRLELASAPDESAGLARFRDLIWERVSQHYIAEQGLAATDADIAEFLAYHREFERRDRVQRARKLEELNQRLAKQELPASERAWLEEFRAVLTRLAQYEAEKDRAEIPDPREEAALSKPYVEMWKLNKVLHEQYGGVVAMTTAGPEPRAARAALLRDYERRGLIRFSDPQLKQALFASLAKPPPFPVPPAKVDFTPYWTRPIPPSYFAD